MLSKLLRLGEGRMVKRLKGVADYVGTLSDDIEKLSDAELRAKTDEFKDRLANGEDLDDIMPEAFAVAREAAWRVLSQRHFDVQVMGGAALHFGNVAEMKTGEGKTLTAVLPAYLNALLGEGVHVITVNDYLAKRDAEWMGRVHRFLGLEVGVILSQMTPDERRAAYNADITYGTNNEFGFDYLRDNMALRLEDCVQRGHRFAIVDEVDSILIDEARTPLIISGPADGGSNWYTEFARLAPLMKADVHYEVDIKKRTVGVHEIGVEFIEDQLGIENLYEAANSPLISYLNNSIKAKELFERDKHYIVRKGEVLIVDDFTGRVLMGRRYNEGLHQAIEAKEQVEIKAENQTVATITLQNYFRLYDKLAGMTGTAETEAAELHEIYKLGVVPIPTNMPMIRSDQSDLIYKTEEAKFIAVVDDVAERYEKGQPVLIGTTSVERSEFLSRQFQKRRIPHNVLNAKFHEQEAGIIAEAGRRAAITVATNMAGRGTDVVLGGNVDYLLDRRLRERNLDPIETPDEYEAAWHEELPLVKEEVAAEAKDVCAAGGLYVLGTERHESRRIDNQLRGRSGRQGDPGESRFYLSLADELMRRFNGATLETLLTRLNLPDDVPIEAKMVSRAIKSAQTQVEQQNFDIRKEVLKYDEVMNQQRKVIYAERRRILEGENLAEQAHKILIDVITAYVDGATAEGYSEDWDLEKLWEGLRQLYPVEIDHHDLIDSDAVGEPGELTRQELLDVLIADAERAYAVREQEVEGIAGEGAMRQLERNVLLSVLDRKWREHLYEMDYLREGIGLRGLAQQRPEVEYAREGFDMFVGMLEGMKEESVGFLFNVGVEAAPAPAVSSMETPPGLAEFAAAAAAAAESGKGGVATKRRPAASAGLRAKGTGDGAPPLTYSGPSEDGSVEVQRSGGGKPADANGGGTRRERREAARQRSRQAKDRGRR
ncbi:MAG: preprotein translocase subunit SecA [Actinomycetia bacterium]|nr:preprotein translocase subunit SecA [Actinomycetes bacterium]